MIWGVFGGSLLCLGLALFFWLPSQSLVHDLRADGVTVVATVTGVDNKPRYVRVRLLQGARSGTETELWDYAGMLPDAHSGDSMMVTYDPKDPSRALLHSWVVDPPTNLPAFGASALAALFLAGALIGAVRRRRLLRAGVTRSSPPAQA
ncbi:DUF3592 domain-containing protein [Streptomyces marokkonensis]|uniref:DUF3592 domain-containing protein n=1 Tax=Streptomyces marokkonensis TaxID=324855 RepID=A0ABW6Q7R2_9ACTN